MGTRGCIGFRLNGKDRLTYNHYDSYPSELGKTMLQFVEDEITLRDYESCIQNLRREVDALVVVKGSRKPTKKQIEHCKPFTDLKVGKQSTTDWYCLLRDTQGDPDKMLDAKYFIDSCDFMEESLFCEWAYIINLDDETLEVYKGFQRRTNDDRGRYRQLPLKKLENEIDNKYGAVALIETIPLKNILGNVELLVWQLDNGGAQNE